MVMAGYSYSLLADSFCDVVPGVKLKSATKSSFRLSSIQAPEPLTQGNSAEIHLTITNGSFRNQARLSI